MGKPMVSMLRAAFGAAVGLLAGCFPSDSGNDSPKPEAPRGLALAYDTATGVVTVSWLAGLDSVSHYVLTRTDSLSGYSSGTQTEVMTSTHTVYRDTLFGLNNRSVRIISHYAVQSVVRRDPSTVSSSDPSPSVRGVFPSPLALSLFASQNKTVAIAGTDARPSDTLAFGGFMACGFPLDGITYTFGRGASRLDTAPAGLTLAHKPWSLGQNDFNFSVDGRLRVVVGDAEPGDYYLHVSARAGRFSLEDSVRFRVSTSDPLVIRTVSMGAQASPNLGSYLDLDDFRVFTAAGAHASAAAIDLVFAWTTISPFLFSPKHAVDSLSTGTDNAWVKEVLGDQAQAISLRKLVGDFDDLTTLADLDSAWASGPDIIEGRVPLGAGFAFMALSDRGLPAALRVISVDSSSTGKVSLEVKSFWEAP